MLTGSEDYAYKFERAEKIARAHQPDAEAAARAVEAARIPASIARAALRSVFGFDVLAAP